MKRHVAILSDSTCDLSEELIKKNNIIILPLYVNFKDETYKDGVDISTDILYEKVKEKNYLPKTSAVTIADFMVTFEKLIKQDYDIIFTGISKKMSGTFQNAYTASKEFPENRIYVIDSMNLSSGIGLLLLHACKWRDDGYSALEIKDKMIEMVPLIRSQFAIETMEYLYKGGRCNSLTALFGTVLKIKPIICVRKGEMTVGKKPRGKMKVALDTLLDYIDHDRENIDENYIMVTHSKANSYAEYLIQKIKEKYSIPVYETFAGCVISSHCGEGTIGILYVLKK